MGARKPDSNIGWLFSCFVVGFLLLLSTYHNIWPSLKNEGEKKMHAQSASCVERLAIKGGVSACIKLPKKHVIWMACTLAALARTMRTFSAA